MTTPLTTIMTALETKRLFITTPMAGPGQVASQEVTIAPGTTPLDVILQLGLPGDYQLRLPNGTHLSGDDHPLWHQVEDGTKLEAMVRQGIVGAPSAKAIFIPPRKLEGWRRMGWCPNAAHPNILEGFFRSSVFEDIAGYVRLRGGDAPAGCPSFYMNLPPEELLHGTHSACYRKRDGAWWIHFENELQVTVTSGIEAIQHQLEACGKKGGR